jgi:hypothetical protein
MGNDHHGMALAGVRSLRPAATEVPKMQKLIADSWNFIVNHEVSPLRHIPDVSTRHIILQILGWMWAVAFSVAIGSYTMLPASLIGHVVLIAAAAITTATYTAASMKPGLFKAGSGRRHDGEHE